MEGSGEEEEGAEQHRRCPMVKEEKEKEGKEKEKEEKEGQRKRE